MVAITLASCVPYLEVQCNSLYSNHLYSQTLIADPAAG